MTAALHLDLLRHGETELGGGLRGSLDDALTPLGWQQMRETVAQASGGWQRIVSSPLQRCALFAAELAGQLEIPLDLEPRLQELHFGTWEGHSAAQLMETDADGLGRFWADPYSFTPPEGEPVADFRLRVLAALADLHLRCERERVLVVCHGGVMRLLLAAARGLPQEQLLQVEVRHGALFPLYVGAGPTLSEP